MAVDYEVAVEDLGVPHRAKQARRTLMLGGANALSALRRGLSHPNPRVREGCHPDAVDALYRALAHAALVLAAIGVAMVITPVSVARFARTVRISMPEQDRDGQVVFATRTSGAVFFCIGLVIAASSAWR